MRFISRVALAIVAFAAVVQACERRADLVDEPDAGVVINSTPKYDGALPIVDAEVSSDAHGACEDRPIEACKGANDFTCGFGEWVREIARTCQKQTGCKTNGWVTVKIGDDGCVDDIGMDRPNAEIVECLVAELVAVRCPCLAQETTYYFGESNAGVCPDGGPKG